LRVPKAFLNYEESAGDGKNLALMDIRFTRTINRIQQAFLMELTKVATIHLFLLGFEDEMTNFTLSMNNPSTQAEQLEIENLQKKIAAVRDAVSDPGTGIPPMSMQRALKTIMKWSDKDIKENFEEIRLEKGIQAELEKTTQIIKRTGIFDTVDRIYGEPGAEYQEQPAQGGMDGGGAGGGGGMMGGAPPMDAGGGTDFGSELDGMDQPGADESGDIVGEEGSMPTQDIPMESYTRKKPLIIEGKPIANKKDNNAFFEFAEPNKDSTLFINEEFDKMISALGEFVNEKEEKK